MVEKRSKQTGFTLIEVMISLMVFTIGMLAVAQLMGTAISGDGRANLLTQAELLAEQQLEQLMVLPYEDDVLHDFNGDGVDDLIDFNDDGFAGLDNITQATADGSLLGAGNGAFNIFWNVAKGAVGTTLENTMTIRVTVVAVQGSLIGPYQLNFIKLAGDVPKDES